MLRDGLADIKKSWDYVVEETLRGAFEASSKVHEEGLVAKAQVLPQRVEFDQAHRELYAAALDTLNADAGSMATSSTASPWKEKLASVCEQVYARELTNLEMASERLCTETADNLLETEIRKPLENGDFDCDFGSYEGAITILVDSYNSTARGPSKSQVLLNTLCDNRKVPAMQRALNSRLVERHGKQVAEMQASVQREDSSRKQVQAMLDGRNQLIDQMKETNAQNEKTLEKMEDEKKRVQDAKESDFVTAEKDMRSAGQKIERFQRENAELKSEVERLGDKEVKNMEMMASMSEEQYTMGQELHKWKAQADPRIRTQAFSDENMEKIGFKARIQKKMQEKEQKAAAKKAGGGAPA
jgi:hypothetical protein